MQLSTRESAEQKTEKFSFAGSASKNVNLMMTLTFASFMIIQLVILRMGNSAGRGFLPDELSEKVYLFLQIIVIAGFLSSAFLQKQLKNAVAKKLPLIPLGIGLCGFIFMLFAPIGSALYLAVTGVSVFCVGFIGSFTYSRMSEYSASGTRTGLCLGIGYACAIAIQFVLQHQWSIMPLLVATVFAAFAALALILSSDFKADSTAALKHESLPAVRLFFPIVITFGLLLFTGYFNSYIHHRQIITNYSDYNAYSWPRLLMIAGILLFGIIGDFKGGKLLPVCTVCVTVLALLNTTLLGPEKYLVSMCLYFLSLSAVISYYHQTFLRLAASTKTPQLWACMGRLLDSAVVIFTLLLNFNELSPSAMLTIDILSLAVIIVAMSLNGDFNLSIHKKAVIEAAEEPPHCETEEQAEALSEAEPRRDPFEVIREHYGLSPAELRVFRELVLTEDKQAVIGDRLSIKLRTVQANVTSIYRKTGLNTRSGLVQLYNNSIMGK